LKPQVLASLAFAFALISSSNLRANTITYGPLTFGSNVPLQDGGPCPSSGQCVEPLTASYIFENGIGVAPYTVTQITTFTFDIAPGWSIDGMHAGGSFDYYYPGEDGIGPDTPVADWGFEFFQELVVCSDADICSSGTQTLKYGGASLPLPPSDLDVGPGTGVYETFMALDDIQIQTLNQPQVNIFVSQTPEPSSWVLLSTGLLGGLVLLVKKRRTAPR
jgi:hypothetical protein